MKLFVTLSKRTLFIIFSLLVIAVIALGQFLSADKKGIDGSTNMTRCHYINSLGLQIDETCLAVKEIIIPNEFNSVYTRYNLLQQEAGFDLLPYKGENAIVYFYRIIDNNRIVSLIIKDGSIIGGDISEEKAGGKVMPLTDWRKNE